MVTRIIVVLLVSLVHSSLGFAQAQQAKKVARIGYLASGSPAASVVPDRDTEAFYQGLRELGYIEGKNLIIEYRYAKGQAERLPELTWELVNSKVDLIVATTSPAIRAARPAATTIPIVMMSVGDLVTEGIIDSLARPGGNITGVTGNIPALSGKLLQVLVDAVPRVTRVGVLRNPDTDRLSLTETENAARALRVQLKILEVRNRDELEDAFSATTINYARSLVILPSVLFARNERRIADLSIRRRLPTIFWRRQFAEAGGLLAYGPSFPDMLRRVGVLAGKILNGTKPSELPVEQPTKYELVVNLKTAKQIGVTIPQSLLIRADSVIK